MRSILFLIISLVSVAVLAAEESPKLEHFITEHEGQLFDGDQVYRFVSWNIPNLHNAEDAFSFLGKSPWRWPDEYEVRDALASVRQMGGRVARTYVISVQRKGGDMGENVHVLAPGEFNERAFEALDLVLKVAREEGIRIIIPLVDNWHWWGGVREYEAFSGKKKGAFWTDPQVFADYEKTVEYVLNRRNSLTGVRYRDDPTIFGWETGNELDSPPEWTRRASALFKRIDPNHLVIDGNALRGIPVASLDDPNVDVVTSHHYPNSGNNNAESVVEAVKLVDGRKAYFVGEFGFLPADEAQRVFDVVIDHGVSGALYWSLRSHRREGGFYWHDEPYGGNVFKAYHWPGFPEAEEYNEQHVVAMIRDAAFRIRGLDTPPMPSLVAPTMLPPDEVGNLSWQGSTGARGYDVQRATNHDGPWETLVSSLSDAATQYRPLFSDESAEPDVEYFYRVIAKNEAGPSPASAVVGPVIYTARLLADEMADLSRIDSSEGPVELHSGRARRVQEDIHRQVLGAGAQITYRLPEAIQSVRVWAYAKKDSSPLELSVSTDGTMFVPLSVDRQLSAATAGDYGYLRPLLLVAKVVPSGNRSVRLTVHQGADEVQISRVEIGYGGTNP